MQENRKEIRKTNLLAIKNRELFFKNKLGKNVQKYTLDTEEYMNMQEEEKLVFLDDLVKKDERFATLDAKIGRTMVELEFLTKKDFVGQDFFEVYHNLLYCANRSGFYSLSYKRAIDDAKQILSIKQEGEKLVKVKTLVELAIER